MRKTFAFVFSVAALAAAPTFTKTCCRYCRGTVKVVIGPERLGRCLSSLTGLRNPGRKQFARRLPRPDAALVT